MSDTPQGPGWWQPSDGKFYAPERQTRRPFPLRRSPLHRPVLCHPAVLTLVAVVALSSALAGGAAQGGKVVVLLVAIPVVYIVCLTLARMYSELVAALFRIADDLRAIRRGKGY